MGKGGVSSTHEHHDYVSCGPLGDSTDPVELPCTVHACAGAHALPAIGPTQECSVRVQSWTGPCLQLRKHKFAVPVKREVRKWPCWTPALVDTRRKRQQATLQQQLCSSSRVHVVPSRSIKWSAWLPA